MRYWSAFVVGFYFIARNVSAAFGVLAAKHQLVGHAVLWLVYAIAMFFACYKKFARWVDES